MPEPDEWHIEDRSDLRTMILELAHKAMELLLAGDDPVLAALRDQYRLASVRSTEFTGVGLYINYDVPQSAANLPRSTQFCFGDIEGQARPLEHGVGFLLCIAEGMLSFLEIYTFDEPWPDELVSFNLSYVGGKRDIEELRKAWS